jgi:hypothetical protein
LAALPLHARRNVATELGLTLPSSHYFHGQQAEADEDVDSEAELWQRVARCDLKQHQLTVAPALRAGIGRIVARSSLTQSVKGIFTAGLGKSLLYAGAKLAKARA